MNGTVGMVLLVPFFCSGVWIVAPLGPPSRALLCAKGSPAGAGKVGVLVFEQFGFGLEGGISLWTWRLDYMP